MIPIEIVIIIGVVIGLSSFFAGYRMARADYIEWWQLEAIDHGYARYDEKTGEWEWIEKNGKCDP